MRRKLQNQMLRVRRNAQFMKKKCRKKQKKIERIKYQFSITSTRFAMQKQQYIIVNKTITKSMNTFEDNSESIVMSKKFNQLKNLKQREIKKFRTQRTFFDEINKRKKTITNESFVSMIQSIETMISSQISSSSQKIREKSDKSTSSIKSKKTSTIKKRIEK